MTRKIIGKFIIVFSLSILIGYFLNYNFNRPTYINSFISRNIYNDPVNTEFLDQNFYNCIVDEYNNETSSEVAYTDSLTDSQLEQITNLSCSLEISNLTGLNKLINLTNINFTNITGITNVSFENNTQLQKLTINNNTSLTSLDVNSNINLTELELGLTNLETIDISHNTLLTKFVINSTELSNFGESGFENNTALTYLSIKNCDDITELDISNNQNIETLILDNLGSFSKVTFGTFEPTVKYMTISNITFPGDDNDNEFYLGLFQDLVELNISNTNLNIIDVSDNENLTKLILNNNDLSTIDLSNNTLLTELNLSNNNFNGIDLTNNTSLIKLNLNNNNLSTIDLSNNIALTELNLKNNFKEYIYRDSTLEITEPYTLPSNLSALSGTWTSTDTDIITISDDNIVSHSNTNMGTIEKSVDNGTLKYNISVNVYVIEITSSTNLIDGNNVYLGFETYSTNNINVNNASILLNIDSTNKKLEVKKDNKVIKEFDILYFLVDGYAKTSQYIYTDNVALSNFDSLVNKSSSLTYKVFNGETEVNSGNISNGYKLKVYYYNTLVKEYILNTNYLVLNESLSIDNDNIINNVSAQTTASTIKSKITTNGTFTIKNNLNETVNDNDYIGTGSTININFSDNTVVTYTVKVLGDVTGDGEINAADAYDIILYSVSKKNLASLYISAGKVNEDELLDAADAYDIMLYSVGKKSIGGSN